MEDPAGVNARRGLGAHEFLGVVLSGALLVGITCAAWGEPRGATDPGRGVPAGGFLWGRLWVDEESPDGPWTPLAGVEVVAYPYVAALALELDRIRETARDSGRQYETAVTRLQEALRTYGRQVDPKRQAASPSPRGVPSEGAPPKDTDDRGPVRRRTTDPAGVFVFDELPPGEWLVVAIRIAPYGPLRPRREEARPGRPREPRFAGAAASSPAREAEVWLERVRVGPGQDVRLFWSERARWLAGPIR